MRQEIKKPLCYLNYGNKAFIISLDAFLALIVVSMLFGATYLYVANLNPDSLADLQTIRTGADVFAILDYNNTLNSFNQSNIQKNLDDILPNNYDMKIRLNCNNNKSLETTHNSSENRFVGSGERIFVVYNETTDNLDYCNGRFWIWVK